MKRNDKKISILIKLIYSLLFPYNLNPETGEHKQIERKEQVSSFFNFFTNLKTPSEEEIKKLSFEVERELGAHLDTEYELGVEFTEEIIPYASQFFAGVTYDADEYHEYAMEQMENKF